MKHLSIILLFLFLVVLGFSSCGDEPDGKWDEMKWINVNSLMNVNGVYIVSESGGTYTFKCTNYNHPWISSVAVDGIQQMLNNDSRLEFDGEWCEVIFVGNELRITILPLPSSIRSRSLNIEVTAGDIFDHLQLIQREDIYY